MNLDFWHDKWERMEIGFHLDKVNPQLQAYWPQVAVPPGGAVLVPLCGKSLDLIWLRRQGWSVVGIELSEIALDALAQAFASELNLTLNKTDEDGRTLYRGDGVLLIAGDFFSIRHDWLQQQAGGRIAAVYDRAAMVALPATMRAAYCRQMLALTEAAPQLLIALDYDQSRRNGPPFAVTAAELQQHYGGHYRIETLEDKELIDAEPRFRAQGLASFRQCVYLLRRV